MHYGKKTDKVNMSYSYIIIYFGMCCFSASLIVGWLIEKKGFICETWVGAVSILVASLIGALLLTHVLCYLFDRIGIQENSNSKSKWYGVKWWGIIFGAYFLIWMAYYPGIAAYDANIQIMQYMEKKITTHHPILHTLFLGALYDYGVRTKSGGMGIDLYVLLQMLGMSGIFAYALHYLYQLNVKKWKRVLCGVFFAFFPVNSVLAISTTKDSLFGAFLLLYIIQLQKMLRRKFLLKDMVIFTVTSVIMLLFRNNAIYALLGSMPVMIFFVGERKKFVKVQSVVLVLFFIVNWGLMVGVNAEKGSPIELMSVPSQQMGRVGYFYRTEVNSLQEYIPASTLQEYDPYLADKIKFNMNAENIRSDKKGYLKEWARLGLKYPGTYLNAFLLNNIGFWYIGDDSHTSIYGDGLGEGYLMDCRLTYNDKPIGVENSQLPVLKDLYHKLFVKNEYLHWWGIRYVFAPAFWWWSFFATILYAFYRKQKWILIPGCFLIVYYASLLFGPTCLVRYIYPIMVCVPILWGQMGISEEVAL